MSSHHRILGVPINASALEIKRAYFKKAKLLHPDVNKSPNAEKEFVRLNMAYEALTNPLLKIPSITIKRQPQKSNEQIRREKLHRQQEESRKRAEVIAKMYRTRNNHFTPKQLLIRDLKQVGQFFLSLVLGLGILVGIPVIFSQTGFQAKMEGFFSVLRVACAFGVIFTAPSWLGIISFYLFPEKK